MVEYAATLILVLAIVLLIIWIITNCTPLRGSSWHIKQQEIMLCSEPKQYHNNKEKVEKENQPIADPCKTPAWINLQGPLALINRRIMYNEIFHELELYHNRQPSHNLQAYLLKKFELSRKDDMAVMSLIQGTYAAAYMTGDTKQALTWCKQLLQDIHTYHLKNPAIATAVVNWIMYGYYTIKGKAGKAHSALQAAVSCIQHHAPSTWTARVCTLQGIMYDRMAQVRPRQRNKYQDLALRCFTNAREHCSCLPFHEGGVCSYYPIVYTLFMANVKLDVPTTRSLRYILTAVTPHLTTLTIVIIHDYLMSNGELTTMSCVNRRRRALAL